VFGTTPRSGGAGQRIMLAILIGIVYFVINRSVNHLGLALDIAPILSASVPMIFVMIVSAFFMSRIH
jgi:lipopolysaccharide export system permease protein